MRKPLLSLLCLLLIACLLFAGCKKKADPAPEQPADAAPTETTPTDSTYTLTEHYQPEAVMTAMETAIREEPTSAFTGAQTNQAPYVINDVFALSDCRVKSITVPVHHTGKADSGGNFKLTIYVGGNTHDTLQEKESRVIPIALNGEEYGLTANSNELRLITVDLEIYDIKLTAEETLGFYAEGDTIVPALIPASESVFGTYYRQNAAAYDTYINAFKHSANGSWSKDNPGLIESSLPLDFELERTWESKEAHDAEVAAAAAAEAEYQRKLTAVREYYRGKNLSLMGDSISTFGGVTNNGAINSTIAINDVYYSASAVYPDYSVTYWGTVKTLLEMDLCVINSWSGSKTYGSESKGWVDNMPERADQLHTDGGKQPDLIIVNMGINDILTSPFGDLPAILAAADDKQAAFATWYTGVLATAATTGGTLTPGTTWTDWFAAYALGIKIIKETYPNAEIYCMTLMESYHGSGKDKSKIDDADLCIRTIAEHFGAKLIDQQLNGHITKDNCILYGRDPGVYALHPNLRGHKMMARCIIEELYRGLPTA